MFKLDKNKNDNTFYPLFDAQFVTNRKQLAWVYMQYNDSFAKYRCNVIDV